MKRILPLPAAAGPLFFAGYGGGDGVTVEDATATAGTAATVDPGVGSGDRKG